jgi:hypothetical protein
MLLTTEEAAMFLNLAPYTLKSWRTRRHGQHLGPERGPKYVRLGGRIRYRAPDLVLFIKDRVIDPSGRCRRANKRRKPTQ